MIHFARWKMILVAIVCVLGLGFAAPNLLSDEDAAGLPGWLPNQKINLGLDLQGGSHLLLEVEIDAVKRERQQALVDGIRDNLLRERPRIGYRQLGIRGDCVGFPRQARAAVAMAAVAHRW